MVKTIWSLLIVSTMLMATIPAHDSTQTAETNYTPKTLEQKATPDEITQHPLDKYSVETPAIVTPQTQNKEQHLLKPIQTESAKTTPQPNHEGHIIDHYPNQPTQTFPKLPDLFTTQPQDAGSAVDALLHALPGDQGHPAPPVDNTSPNTGDSHVLIGIADTGVNVYHEAFYRPTWTQHPCTYIEDFPCNIPTLPLSVGPGLDYNTAFTQDANLWANVQPDTWYWIPQTVFVAISCESGEHTSPNHCFLDDGNRHGTGVVGSAVTENHDARIAFVANDGNIHPFTDNQQIPIDIHSVSWGFTVPMPRAAGTCDANIAEHSPLFVKSAGNEPGHSSLLDCWAGDPRIISVGGAYAHGNGYQEVRAFKETDIVSYYCRTVPGQATTDQYEIRCGTSFAAPTVAGALSKVILDIRQDSGYTGSGITPNGYIDPIHEITADDLKEALWRTASYNPKAQYNEHSLTAIPKLSVAPWLQWGWGFYDATVAEDTTQYLLGTKQIPEKPLLAQYHMATLSVAKHALYDY